MNQMSHSGMNHGMLWTDQMAANTEAGTSGDMTPHAAPIKIDYQWRKHFGLGEVKNENTAPMWLVVVAQNAICSFEEEEEENQ